eukprot:94698_1
MLVAFLITIAGFTISNANNCCQLHHLEATCVAETGQNCVWIPDGDLRLTVSKSGRQCVGKKNANCLQKIVDSGDKRAVACTLEIEESEVSTYRASALSFYLDEPIVRNVDRTCEFEPCTNDAFDYNIQFIFDESGSVGSTNYKASVDFVLALIENDVNSVAAVSVLSFSSSSNIDVLYSFSDDQTSRTGVLAATSDAKNHYSGGSTYTRHALEVGVSLFKNDADSKETNFLFLITDGIPSGSSDPCDDSSTSTTLLNEIDNLNIRVLTMGIGNFDATRLACLDPTTNDENTFLVPGFTPEDFSKLEEDARPMTCPAATTMDMVLAALYHPYRSFMTASAPVQAIVAMVFALVMYGLYRYYTTKDAHQYKLIPTETEAAYGSV